MRECHPGTDVELTEGVATSGFRCAIPNTKRYIKYNRWSITDVAHASYEGDFDKLEELLKTGDESNLFNGDLNEHVAAEAGFAQRPNTALQLAAIAGQTECIELLLEAKADPHVRESVPYGENPEEGNTALDIAKKFCWDDCVELLEEAEAESSYGWYVPAGPGNNARCYGCWEWGEPPPPGWYMSRPGAAEKQGLDPARYGAELAEPESDEDVATVDLRPLEKREPIGLLFPGQGSQYVKMMTKVQEIPAVREMLERATAILGYDVLQLCLAGPEDQLEETAKCQPAVFIAGLAGLEKLRRERKEVVSNCQAMAGLSLGEYTALCAAGVFSFDDALTLVKLRGQAMQEAATASGALSLTVAGIEKQKLRSLCEEALHLGGAGAVCQIASELFPRGYSVAGTSNAIRALKELVDREGAMQVKVLRASGGFSTPLMQSAQDKLAQALEELLPRMSSPKHTVYMNATGMAVKPGTPPSEIAELLRRQITSPVLWEESVRGMIQDGVRQFYEVGPMKQIKAMMKRIDPCFWSNTFNVEV